MTVTVVVVTGTNWRCRGAYVPAASSALRAPAVVEELELQVETRLFHEFGMHEAASIGSCLSVSHVDPVAVRTKGSLE